MAREAVKTVVVARMAGILPIEITDADVTADSTLAAVSARRIVPRQQEGEHIRRSGFTREQVTAAQYRAAIFQVLCQAQDLQESSPAANALLTEIERGLPEDIELGACMMVMSAELERKYDVPAYRVDFWKSSGRALTRQLAEQFIARQMLADIEAKKREKR